MGKTIGKIMYKILIWGTGRRYCQLLNLIRYYEVRGEICVVGVTSNDDFYAKIDGYPFIPKEKLGGIEFDYIILCIDDCGSVVREAEALFGDNIRERMIEGRILQYPDFDFARYIMIRKSVPSIISKACFGGMLYHQLDLPFQSPTINMFWLGEDYYKLLCNLKAYMEEPLEFWKMGKDKTDYPICVLGDIHVHMNHDRTYEEAKRKWERRKGRIDYDNLVIVNYTQDRDDAERFCELPYERTLCFTDFAMKGCIDITDIYMKYSGKKSICQLVNESAYGTFRLFNPFMLLNGDK